MKTKLNPIEQKSEDSGFPSDFSYDQAPFDVRCVHLRLSFCLQQNHPTLLSPLLLITVTLR